MNNDVKRWDLDGPYHRGDAYMSAVADGDYVLASDFDALRAENEQLTMECEQSHSVALNRGLVISDLRTQLAECHALLRMVDLQNPRWLRERIGAILNQPDAEPPT